jgi:hypothetical protein
MPTPFNPFTAKGVTPGQRLAMSPLPLARSAHGGQLAVHDIA